jgi:hypothetical protein
MIKIRSVIIFLFLLSIPAVLQAQRWKRERYEFSFGVGASNFLGELGGANQIGTHYFKDFEWSATRLAAAVGMRYKLNNYFALKTHLTYGRVYGDDKLTEEFFRRYRNLNFFSDIYEFNINFEGAFQEEQIGHIHHLRGVRGVHGYELYMYGFVGGGVFYFDPRTVQNGKTYRLQPLGTEGQGWSSSKAKYSLVQFCIPLGVGFKYTLDRTWGIGLELGIRKTFTDYIDDVSTKYYDFSQSPDAPDIVAQLADRSDNDALAMNRPQTRPTVAGDQRGNPKEKDSYMFAIFSINYKIKNGRGNLPRF